MIKINLVLINNVIIYLNNNMRIRLKIPFHAAKLLIYILQIYQKYMLKNIFPYLLLYAIEIQKVMVMQTFVLVFRNVSKKFRLQAIF